MVHAWRLSTSKTVAVPLAVSAPAVQSTRIAAQTPPAAITAAINLVPIAARPSFKKALFVPTRLGRCIITADISAARQERRDTVMEAAMDVHSRDMY